MKLYYYLRNKLNLMMVPVIVFTLASCGSYQYSGYEADGIYGESRPGIWEQEERTTEVKPNNDNTYYKDLFGQQSEMYGEILESDVFTDVDEYSSNDGYEDYNDVGGDVAYVGGNAPWGNDPDSYTINIINNGFYSPWRFGFGHPFYGGWNDPFFWNDPFYWNRPYGWGWYGRGFWGYPIAYGGYWNFGFGFNYGYGYWNRPFYPYYYHNRYPYRYNNRVAHNAGRRNSTAYYRDGENRRSTTARNSYSRSIREIRNSRNSDYNRARVNRSASNNDNRQIYTRTNRRTESSRSYDYSRSNRSSSPVYQRSSRSSNNRSYQSSGSRRSSSPARSTTRSSGSSSRSSGTTSRGGGRSSRGGRGGGL